MDEQGWPLWRRDDPASLLGYVQADGIAPLLAGLPLRAEGWDGDQRARLRAVYEAFAKAGIQYADEPITGAGQAQQIRPPDQVLARWPRYGNCLDLAVTFAGACLNAGLHPLLAVCQPASAGSAHAVVLVWTSGGWPGAGGRYPLPGPADDSVLIDMPRWPGGLCQRADGPGQFIPVDIFLAAARFGQEPASFGDAVVSAAALLNSATATADGAYRPAPASGSGQAAAGQWRWDFGLDIGQGYRPETALLPPGWPKTPPLEPVYQDQASTGAGPLAQLRARTEMIRFVDRGELGFLLGWCQNPELRPGTGAGTGTAGADVPAPPVRIAVIEGVGGSGKTRLAAEVAKTLSGQGWYAGCLVRRIPAEQDLLWLATLVAPLVVVVDYVEATDVIALGRAIRTLATRRSPTVLLFTARTRGEWWHWLDRELTTAGITRSVFPRLELPPRPRDSQQLFYRAYRRFATAGDSVAREEPPDPAVGTRWTSLDLVMLAWLAARVGPGLPATPADLYEAVIGRELDSWAEAIDRADPRRPSRRALRIAAACIGLLSPPSQRLPDLLDQAGIRLHTSLAPGEIAGPLTELLGQPAGGELHLTPDPVADYLLLTTFPGEPAVFDACVDLAAIDPVAGQAAPAPEPPGNAGRLEPERLCDNLTRAGEAIAPGDAETIASELATTALRRRPGLWRAAFEVALYRGGAFVPGLQELAARPGTPLPLSEISNRIPPAHTALLELAVTAARHVVAVSDDDDTPARQAAKAAALDALAIRLSAAGRRDEALERAQEAVASYRSLTQGAPGRYRADLARALNTMALALSAVGRRDEALDPAQEAVTLRQQLARASSADLALSLNTLATSLSEAGRRDGALERAQEVAGLYRQLAQASPGEYLDSLGMSLNNLALRLAQAGRREEALDPIREAVALRRQLAETSPGTHLDSLAGSLTSLGTTLYQVGHLEEAVAAAREAADLYRRLAQASPGARQYSLARSLGNLTTLLSKAGHGQEALVVARETVAVFGQLAEDFPDAHLGDLALALSNLAMQLSGAGQRAEALERVQEAIDIYRRQCPASSSSGLARALGQLALGLWAAGRREEALKAVRESVQLRRELVQASPAAHEGDLAFSLNVLGVLLAQAGRPEEALGPAREAVALYQSLAEASPAAYLGDLAGCRSNLAALISATGRREEAVALSQEAVADFRRLADGSRTAYLGHLAESLTELAKRLSAAGRQEEAVGPALESVGLYRELDQASRDASLGDRAAALNNVAALLANVGRREEALTAAEEAVAAFRRLAAVTPHLYLGGLATSLHTLANQLAEAGRPDEALAAAREAVDINRPLAQASPDAHRGDLAMSLNTLANQLAGAGQPDEALEAAQEAVDIYRLLAHASPEAYRGSLAMSLNNLALRLAQAGQQGEAPAAAEQAVDIYRPLAQASPRAYLGALAGTLNNQAAVLAEAGRLAEALAPAREAAGLYLPLTAASPEANLGNLVLSLITLANRLSALGRREEAMTAFADAARDLTAGPRAEIQLALASWLANHPGPADGIKERAAALAAAVESADAETDPMRAGPTRRAVRTAVTASGPAGLAVLTLAGPLPDWASVELPDELVTLFDDLLNMPRWALRAAALRERRGAMFLRPAARQTWTALAALHADNDPMLDILRVLDAASQRGLDPVLDEECAAEQRAQILQDWLACPIGIISRRYLGEHHALLTDERTAATLAAAAEDPKIRRHLAIVRLADTMSLDEVYDIVLDAAEARAAVLAALDAGDLNQVTEIWHAAAHLEGEPFTQGYVAAVLLASDGRTQEAARVMSRAAANASAATRLAGAERLHRLAAIHPALTGTLTELASLLTSAALAPDAAR